jgi:hypothetical protein
MGSNSSIGCATSPDGITWQRDTVHNPVLRTGAVKAWDFAYIMNPRVLQIENTYYMWYQGEAGNAIRSIGCATSKDAGITWTKEASNPVLSSSPGTWDASNLEPGGVLLRGDTLHMWYDGANDVNAYRIGHATSPLIIIAITGRTDGIPEEFMLAQNYPNPFNPRTGIRFQVLGVSDVKISVFDLLGREVALLVNEKKTPGSYEVQFDGSGLASGVYFYRLTAASFVQTRKMLLVR